MQIPILSSYEQVGSTEYKNFVNTMIRLGQTKPEVRVIADQFGAPTSVVDLSRAISSVISDIETYRGEILHFANETKDSNGISWFEFAQEIFRIANIQTPVIPITTEEYKVKAVRPKNSRLVNNSNIRLRGWKEGLREYI